MGCGQNQGARHARSAAADGPDGSIAVWLQSRIAGWPEVRVLEHRARGRRFCAYGGEFLHFHAAAQMDVRLTPVQRDRAIENGAARFHPRSHEGGWVIVRLDEPVGGSPIGIRSTALRLAAAAYRARRALSKRVPGERAVFSRNHSDALYTNPRPCAKLSSGPRIADSIRAHDAVDRRSQSTGPDLPRGVP